MAFDTPIHPRKRIGATVHQFPGTAPPIDRVRCAVCGFAGIPLDTVPGEGFPTAYRTEGTTYVWESPTDSIATLDLTVLPVPNSGVSCPFCGATQFLTGSNTE